MHLTFSLTNLPFLLHISTQILIISATQPSDISSPSSYDSVRNTLAHYPLAIDGKDFSLLSQVFTYNAVANYSPPINTLYGLPQIESVLEAGLRPVSTHHSFGTQEIEVYENGTADVITYITASHFGVGPYLGQVLYAYGKYFDHLVLSHEIGWRIDRRHFVYMGPNIGNNSIFTGTETAPGAPSS